MCYSPQIKADYGRFVRTFGARSGLEEFTRLYWEREQGAAHLIPKAVDAMFLEPRTADEQRIKDMIERFNRSQATKLEEELFKQRTRLADAERALQAEATKAAAESKRSATNKVESLRRRLDDLRRTELPERDARFFPGHYAPIIERFGPDFPHGAARVWGSRRPPGGTGFSGWPARAVAATVVDGSAAIDSTTRDMRLKAGTGHRGNGQRRFAVTE